MAYYRVTDWTGLPYCNTGSTSLVISANIDNWTRLGQKYLPHLRYKVVPSVLQVQSLSRTEISQAGMEDRPELAPCLRHNLVNPRNIGLSDNIGERERQALTWTTPRLV